MEIYNIIVIVIRLLLVIASLSLLILSVKQFSKRKTISIVLLALSLVNIYFMFIHNQIQVSPLYKDFSPNSLYEEFIDSYNQNNYYMDFRSENNFYGSYSIEKGKTDTVEFEYSSGDYEYHIDKYVYLNRDIQLLLTPVDYHGKIYIYSKSEDKTLTINYNLYLSNENSENLFSLNEYTCSGVEKSYTFDNIVFDE